MKKIIVLLLCLQCFTGFSQDKKEKKKDEVKKEEHKNEAKKKDEEKHDDHKKALERNAVWQLPKELNEVSGITYVGDEKVACIQDEIGILYIYDLKKKTIIKEITFAGKADYEGLAIVKNDAYVLRSDGLIYHIEDYAGLNPMITQIHSPLNAQHNAEGFCYDSTFNRILIAIKGIDPLLLEQKPVYSLDLNHHTVSAVPVFSIELNDPLLSDVRTRSFYQKLQISEITVLPNGNYLISDAVNGYMYSLNSKGKLLTKVKMDRDLYPQSEGMTIYNKEEMIVSNEGKNGKAFLVKSKISDWLK